MQYYFRGASNILIMLLILLTISCKKLITVPPPVSAITSSQVFSRDDQATEAMNGIYSEMINNSDNINKFCNGAMSIYTGASADELLFYNQVDERDQFQTNNLTQFNSNVDQYFWTEAYSLVYRANAIIQGLEASSGVHDNVKTELAGEAKFIRALCHFYLLNLFGEVPIVTSINYHSTSLLSRSSMSDVYQQIINDLQDAQANLRSDYSMGSGERIIPNKGAAIALLARTYLYIKDWANAETQASSLINSAQYKLPNTLDSVFLKNNTEAIWQLKQNNKSGSLNATPEGFNVIPYDAFSEPFIYLRKELLNSFEVGDKRKNKWIDSTKVNSIVYYYPKKYKVGPTQSASGPYNEYYMVFRLSEQYLIRAEARAIQGNLSGAINDINVIRTRAGLPSLPNTLSQSQVVAAIQQENRIEFFAEWGHRWLDLKRWGGANAVLGPIKGGNWQITDQLYPIPQYEVNTGANMQQNSGY